MLRISFLRNSALLSLLALSACANSRETVLVKDTASATVLTAIKDFSAVSEKSQLWYVDDDRQCLAVNAEKYKDQFAKVQTTFSGPRGKYQVSLTALTETDGESQYQVSVGDNQLAMVTNPETTVEFAPHIHRWNDVALEAGDTISVAFNSATNGKIPEGDTTAYSRGRWTKLELLCTSVCNY